MTASLLLLVVAAAAPTAAQSTTAVSESGDDDAHLNEDCGAGETEGVAEYWRSYNGVIYATVVFGWLSILACLAVLAVSYAHGKGRRSLRARIIAGLFVSNLVFSIGIANPNVYVCQSGTYTQVVGPTTEVGLKALLYGGKMGMMAYELFIVVTSIAMLRSGTINMPRAYEILGHAICFAVGLTVFVFFVLKAGPQWEAAQGWQTPEELEAEVRWSAIGKDLMDGWVVLFGIFILLWVGLRFQLHMLTKEWGAVVAETKEEWQHEDRWIAPDTAVHDARDRKQQLMDLQKQSYREVVMPLAPYVWTFLAFSIPAIVMATDYCTAETTRVDSRNSGPAIECFMGCYMVLALRPLATAAVYFRDPQCRAELRDCRTIGRKLWRRLSDSFAWAFGLDDRRHGTVRFNRQLEGVRIIDDGDVGEVDAGSDHDGVGGCGGGDDGTATGASVRYELMED